MQRLLLIIFVAISQLAMAQRGYLFIKKGGYKKVRTFAEGSSISFSTKDYQIVQGVIALVKSDSIMVNGIWYKSNTISRVYLRGREGSILPALLLTTAGVGLSTAGMTLAKWANFKRSLGYSAGIGYGNFLIRQLPALKRKKYNIGKKYSVHTLDLHF